MQDIGLLSPAGRPSSDVRVDPPRGADVWASIVDVAISLFRTQAFHRVTIKTVADAAALPLEAVREHFDSTDDLLVAVIQVWNAERMEPITPVAQHHGAVAFLRGIVQANVADPALMRLLVATVNIAATPDHPLSPVLQSMWLRFQAMVQRTLARDITLGREPSTMDPARGAEQLIALYEGLQLQSMVRPYMDLLGAYDRAVVRLRDGWSQTYTPPIWEI